MDRKMLVSFSTKKETLSHIELLCSKHVGANEIPIAFRDEKLLLNFFSNNKKTGANPKILFFEPNSSDKKTSSLLNNLYNFSQGTIIVVLAEERILANIQNNLKKTESFLFFSYPFSETAFAIMLKMALNKHKLLKRYIKEQKENTRLREELNVKIAGKIKELTESNEAKDKFLSIIAHDLKNPFMALLSISEVLLNNRTTLSEAEKIDLLTDLYNSSENTYKLLENLLDWSRTQMEKPEIKRLEIRVGKIIDSNIKIAQNSAVSKKIKIKNQVEPNIRINADENMISAVFRNLITNAVKYTPDGGQVTLTASVRKNTCTFCISDTGTGVNNPHIVELFRAKNKWNKQQENGSSGLGLILCKDFVEQNGGKIWLETETGKGSNFYFTVPLS